MIALVRHALTLAAVAALSLPVTAADPARIEIGDLVRDMGKVPQGEKIDLEYEVRNEGGQPLVIGVRPTCGCTVVKYDEEIAPGEAGKISAVLDTREFSGYITKSILVTSNDPDARSTRLTIKALVQPAVEILPRPMVRLETTKGEPASATLKVAGPVGGDHPIKVVAVRSKSEYVTASFRELPAEDQLEDRPSGQYEVTIQLTGDAPPGVVNAPVLVFTDQKGASEVLVRVLGFVRSAG